MLEQKNLEGMVEGRAGGAGVRHTGEATVKATNR